MCAADPFRTAGTTLKPTAVGQGNAFGPKEFLEVYQVKWLSFYQLY